jgi:uncharacterized protein
MTRRLLLDGMLGSLARWLRIGGIDAEYRKHTPDDALIEEALQYDRIILTRDEVLVNRARKQGIKSIYIKAENDEEALGQLAEELGITLDPTKARCPKCNHHVEKVAKEDVAGRVPEGTYAAVDDYWTCPNCGGIYWRGSHWPRIVETLGNAARHDRHPTHT